MSGWWGRNWEKEKRNQKQKKAKERSEPIKNHFVIYIQLNADKWQQHLF